MRNGNTISNTASEDASYIQGIAVGHCTTWLETFAERSGLPFEVLAERVGTQLLGAAHGQDMGIDNHVSSLRRQTAEDSSTVESLEMDGSSRSKPQVNGHYADRYAELRKLSTLPQQREVACRTCKAKTGEFCLSLGTRGTAKGTEMRTSCHAARVEDAAEHNGYQRPARKSVWTPERRRKQSMLIKRLNFKRDTD